ncbi:MAG: translation initiation factor IF-3 [Patescibacteria group bacterium]|nr:translation initiation factor IF-3 [Patescibacteria group bacterium]
MSSEVNITNKLRINHQIRAPKVRLIDSDGTQIGIVSISEALLKAEESGLDLIEISPNLEVPVCKLMDYGKYKYDLDKKEQKAKKSRAQNEVKGIRLSVKIGKHDFDTKAKRAKEFLEKGHKISLQLRFKGREMIHRDLGEKVLRDFADSLGETITEQEPKMLGRGMTMVLGPGKKKG